MFTGFASARLRFSVSVFIMATIATAGSAHAQPWTGGQIAKFLTTGSNTVANSVITESSSGFIGLGDPNPQTRLWVYGEATITGPSADLRLAPRSGSGTAMWFYNPNGTDLRVSGTTADIATFTSSGNVGIGEPNPQSRLWVNGETTIAGSAGDLRFAPRSGSGNTMWFYNPSGTDLRLSGAVNDILTVQSGGNVGIGIATPQNLLDVGYGSTNIIPGISASANGSWAAGLTLNNTNSTASGGTGILMNVANFSKAYIAANNSRLLTITTTNGSGGWNTGINLDGNGNVGINTASPNPSYALDVNGTIHATNVIGASYQDLAEWVPASGDMAAGTVVILNREKANQVVPSSTAYDVTVAGVVSAKPGIVLGESAPGKAQIATTGRVKVKVDATKEPIKIGDLLVTSDKPGTAMKSVPVNVAGVSMHRPGTIVGKALEPLASGTGEVLVLLSLQ